MTVFNLICSLTTKMTPTKNFLYESEANVNDINLIGKRKFLNEIFTEKKQSTRSWDFTNIVGNELLSFEDKMTSNVSNATTKKAITVTTKINDTQTKNIKRASEYTTEQTTIINALPFSRIKNKALSMDQQKDTASIDYVRHRSRYDNKDQDPYHSSINSTEHSWKPANNKMSDKNKAQILRRKDEEKITTAAKRLNAEVENGEIYTSVTYLTYTTDDFIQRNFTTKSFVAENRTTASFVTSLIQDKDKAKSTKKKYNHDLRFDDSSSNSPTLKALQNFSVSSMIRGNETKAEWHKNGRYNKHVRNEETSIDKKPNETLHKKRLIKDSFKIESNDLPTKMKSSFENFAETNNEYTPAPEILIKGFDTTTFNTSTLKNNNTSKTTANPVNTSNLCKPAFWDKWSLDKRYFDKYR